MSSRYDVISPNTLQAIRRDAELSRLKDRIEKLEAALEDALQYVSRADWHYLKDETRKALEGNDD